MCFTILLLLTFVCVGTAQDLLNISEAVLQDIYNICNGIPLTETAHSKMNVEPNKIEFYLLTGSNTKKYSLITPSNASAVHKNVPIIFLIHGWLKDRNSEWYKELTEIFFNLDSQYNIIEVDYSTYSQANYISAASFVPKIGSVIGEFIVTLIEEYSIRFDNILVIGHSLGGQIGSFVGKRVQELLHKKLPRIITLDPAGPLFEQLPKKQRLNKNDFTIVEVIHSSGGVFGMKTRCGTTDFFLNGGSFQPGCLWKILSHLSDITDNVFCSHRRSWQVFVSALQNPNHFLGKKLVGSNRDCDSKNSCSDEYLDMGDIHTNKTGNYYVNTTSRSPYFE